MTYNTNDGQATTIHQPGVTSIRMTGTLTQYATTTSKDPRGLGRYCSIGMWEKMDQKCRTISAYNVCKGKAKGTRTRYQQMQRYTRNNSLDHAKPQY